MSTRVGWSSIFDVVILVRSTDIVSCYSKPESEKDIFGGIEVA